MTSHGLGMKGGDAGMNIAEAARISKKTQKGITRKSWTPKGPTILPTNTKSGCIVELYRLHDSLTPRWQPSADDLLADDWEPVGYLDKRD